MIAQAQTRTHQMIVELTQARQTLETGFIIPAGTKGRVIGMHVDDSDEWDVYNWLIDFGLPTVITLPVDSPYIKRAGEE